MTAPIKGWLHKTTFTLNKNEEEQCTRNTVNREHLGLNMLIVFFRR